MQIFTTKQIVERDYWDDDEFESVRWVRADEVMVSNV